MAKSAAFGLASGLAVVVLTLIMVALVNLPQPTDAAATTRTGAPRCVVDQSQEQGYGLSRLGKPGACVTPPSD